MTRADELKTYLIDILDNMSKDYQTLNINFLASEVDNYSLDKIPTATTVETTITGIVTKREVYNFRSRNKYGSDIAQNLENIGFWEKFESKIYSNNEKGILPKGIKKIECLNCGSLQQAETQTCEMSIQIQIEYEMEEE